MGCYNSVIIEKSADEVWETIKNFHDLSWSKNVITKLDVVGDIGGGTVGAQRILNDAFHETLLSIDEDGKTFTYSIDDGPGPVAKGEVDGYVGQVTVLPVSDNNTSFVMWTSAWKSANGDGVADFCNPIYHAVLQDMKGHFS